MLCRSCDELIERAIFSLHRRICNNKVPPKFADFARRRGLMNEKTRSFEDADEEMGDQYNLQRVDAGFFMFGDEEEKFTQDPDQKFDMDDYMGFPSEELEEAETCLSIFDSR